MDTAKRMRSTEHRAQRWLSITAMVLASCSGSRSTDAGDAAPRDDIAFDASDAPDVSLDGVVPGDIAPRDTGLSAVTTCSSETAAVPLTPSDLCEITPFTGDPASLCFGSSQCPVHAVHSFTCTADTVGSIVTQLSIVASATGASILTTDPLFGVHLFEIASDASPRVDEFVETFASPRIVADPAGHRSVVGNLSNSIVRFRETSGGWLRTEWSPPHMGTITDARADSAAHFVVAGITSDISLPLISAISDNCWNQAFLREARSTPVGVDLDRDGGAWIAWGRADSRGILGEVLFGPDGAPYSSWISSGPVADGPGQVRVLANGVDGANPYPIVALQLRDGIHFAVPRAAGASSPTWSDVVATGGGIADPRTSCTGGDVCADSCVTRQLGATYGFDLARTSSGRTFAVWTQVSGMQNYTTSQVCDPGCHCVRSPAGSSGIADVVIAHVTASTATPVLTVRFDTGGIVWRGAVAIAARGDVLVVATKVREETDPAAPLTEFRYFEVDTTGL